MRDSNGATGGAEAAAAQAAVSQQPRIPSPCRFLSLYISLYICLSIYMFFYLYIIYSHTPAHTLRHS